MAVDYTVTAQRQTVSVTPDGRFGDVWEVTFQDDATGTVGRVMVPVAAYTPERVQAAIEDQLARIRGVAGL